MTDDYEAPGEEVEPEKPDEPEIEAPNEQPQTDEPEE